MEASQPQQQVSWQTQATGFVVFGIVVLAAIWTPIAAYQRHLQQQSAAMFTQGTAARYMPAMLTRVPAVREFLSVIVPFFQDTARHEWVHRPHHRSCH